MKIYIARHGRTNYNDLGLCNSDPSVDVHLTAAGIQQAKALGEKLKDTVLDQIYVSELKRTQQTADLLEKFGVPVAIDPRLNDNHTGFEGKPASEYYDALNAARDKWNTRFKDGESVEDINKRVRSFVDELRLLEYGAVLIITSEVIVQALYGVLNNLSNEEARSLHVEQGGYIELSLDGGGIIPPHPLV
jgi:broad specificity phosphatase PhoE